MTDYYEIRDRVPRADIDSLTVEAARVWLERNGWAKEEDETWTDGIRRTYYGHGDSTVYLGDKSDTVLRDHGLRMVEAINTLVFESGKRAHVVIAEIRAIGEWLERCKAWVAPTDKCDACWACIPSDLLREVPRFIICPTCGNKRCPRATDHRNGCSGSNEAGQEGSRYA